MFVRRNEVSIEIQKYATMEMFMGFVAVQNPGIFPSNSHYLKYHKQFKKVNPDLLQRVIPQENLDSIEVLIEPILKILLAHGDIILNDFDLNEIDASPQITSIVEITRNVWKLGASLNWSKINERYRHWNEKKFKNTNQVIDLLERQHGHRLSLEHRKIVENAHSIILIPLFFLDTQLGFNFVDGKTIILVGIACIPDDCKTYKDIDPYIRCLAALGEKNRLAIMQKLLVRKDSIEGIELASQLNITPATVSHHLTILRQAGLVSRSKSGRTVRYAPETARLEELVSFLKSMIKEEE